MGRYEESTGSAKPKSNRHNKLGPLLHELSDEPVPLDIEEKPEEFGVGFFGFGHGVERQADLTQGPRGAGQIIAEARTVGTERLAAPQKQGTKWPFWLYPLRVPGRQMARKNK